MVDAPRELVDLYFLKPFQLVDLGQIADEELKQRHWSGIMEFALKHIYARDILPHVFAIVELLKQLAHSDGREYVQLVLQYFLERGELPNPDAFYKLIDNSISTEVGEHIMTLGERLRQEGRQEGVKKGEIKIIELMLANGVEPVFIAKNTGIPLHKIQKMQESVEN